MRVRSPLLAQSRLISSPAGTEMFHFPAFASYNLCIQLQITMQHIARLPDSDIFGSKCACHSPKLFAAYRVLHRLIVPRHPPYALSSLTIFILVANLYNVEFLNSTASRSVRLLLSDSRHHHVKEHFTTHPSHPNQECLISVAKIHLPKHTQHIR